MMDSVEELMDILATECDEKPRMIMGNEVQGFLNLYISYNDVMYALEKERKAVTDILSNDTKSRKKDIFVDIFREFKNMLVNHYMNVNEELHVLKRFRNAVTAYNLSDGYAVNCYFELVSAVYFTYVSNSGNTPGEGIESFMQSLVGADRELAGDITESYLWKMLWKEEGNEHEIICGVKKIVQKDLGQDLTVVNLARRFYVTPNYLSHLFKKYTGEGCYEYIVRKRIEKAKFLLENTSMKMGEIAALVGYQDLNYFSVAFKKHIGQAPTKYRRSVQNAKI